MPFRLSHSPGITCLLISSMTLIGAVAEQSVTIGFLSSETSLEAMGPHDRGAWETAAALGDATLLFLKDAGFVDASGGAFRPLVEYELGAGRHPVLCQTFRSYSICHVSTTCTMPFSSYSPPSGIRLTGLPMASEIRLLSLRRRSAMKL